MDEEDWPGCNSPHPADRVGLGEADAQPPPGDPNDEPHDPDWEPLPDTRIGVPDKSRQKPDWTEDQIIDLLRTGNIAEVERLTGRPMRRGYNKT